MAGADDIEKQAKPDHVGPATRLALHDHLVDDLPARAVHGLQRQQIGKRTCPRLAVSVRSLAIHIQGRCLRRYGRHRSVIGNRRRIRKTMIRNLDGARKASGDRREAPRRSCCLSQNERAALGLSRRMNAGVAPAREIG